MESKNHRKRLRLQDYDYRLPGPYFVTISVNDRRPRFGQVLDGCLHSNDAGEMIAHTWLSLEQQIPVVELDMFVVMPDHFHGILMLNQEFNDPSPISLISIIQRFKSLTTNRYISGVKAGPYPSFDRKLWLRGYHERVLRDERDLATHRAYIEGNPARWTEKHQDQ